MGIHTWEDFFSSNISVLAIFLLISVLVIAVLVLDRHWRQWQLQMEKVTGSMNESHNFSLHLVRHFMPSFKVAKYQFRGMKPKKHTASVEFENLGLDLKSGKRVLNGVTGAFDSGKMCAIMGPSGAGKTTFMNTLCGKATYGNMVGTMKINGRKTDPRDLRSFMGFVPQDDIVHQDLTVREQIFFSAKLRGSRKLSHRRCEFITEDVLNVMQIDHIQNSIVGSVESRGISGGQRKRVNIGLELAAEPTLLFLDEPTSGLDSTSSLAVCNSLQKLCQLGMTSIMVIHQPRYSLFTLFDQVLLLGKGGETVFLGNSSDAKVYFESLGFSMPANENPADWFMDVLSGEVTNPRIPNFKPDMLFQLWREREDRGWGRQAREVPGEVSPGQRRRYRSMSSVRVLSVNEEKAILEQNLEENWTLVDSNKDGVMDAAELMHLLALCCGMIPTEKAVRELMGLMAGQGAEAVTKNEFVSYLGSLSEDVANEERLEAVDVAANPAVINLPKANTKKSSNSDSDESSDEGSSGSDSDSGSESDSTLLLKDHQVARPGCCMQFRILSLRRLVQWWRMNQQRALFFAALGIGGVILGVLDAFIVKAPIWDAMSYLNLHTCLALLLSIFCLGVFGNDRTVFWRESASGINISAYFQAKVWVNLVDILLMTFVFSSIYFLIRQPYFSYWRFVLPFLCNALAASGWGYLISTLVPPEHGPFIVSLVSFIVCGLLGNPTSLGNFQKVPALDWSVCALSISRWAVQLSFLIAHEHGDVGELDMRQQAMLNEFQSVYDPEGLDVQKAKWTAGIVMVAMGIVLRFLSFLALKYVNRSKQV
mmetsp:Transcript_94370/g.197152  ORF Transcript_94370/g.197152 Transcript_94370/m.197152 type:complete len:821 (-) Transcript_94370:251-2713(-)|eukprot:CAMPEP_0206442778 /NCGR_PEP_ID=MMETSP0324_2-20121206/14007_1 /ASSEMBLY_ACC=CAM_ASM_000836 /TAXON_ID=2866 /ORGANISM="Crypthecodinium cohnii, Strain Seligo" /LENGTH=820 /DNA_ID=CAMNT_0053910651 /DNA_START=331 /DNA_END=2793 /DNA_ORIENTATION=-